MFRFDWNSAVIYFCMGNTSLFEYAQCAVTHFDFVKCLMCVWYSLYAFSKGLFHVQRVFSYYICFSVDSESAFGCKTRGIISNSPTVKPDVF